jgi:hypothetical protein
MMIGPAFTPLPSLFDQSLDFELVAPNFYFISPYNMTVEEMPHTGRIYFVNREGGCIVAVAKRLPPSLQAVERPCVSWSGRHFLVSTFPALFDTSSARLLAAFKTLSSGCALHQVSTQM